MERDEVASWVKQMTDEMTSGPPFAIGDTVTHPSGRTVQITRGQWWGVRGLSNHWYWREVMADGSLGPEEHGYGWRPGVAP